MKFAFVGSLLVLGLLSGGSAFGSKAHILSFKTWKQKKIDEARTVVTELKHQSRQNTQVKIQNNEEYEGDDGQDPAQKLAQAELNLGVAKELSANDYFLLYVSPQFKNDNEALVQAAKALSPKDMADILMAYQKRLQNTDISPSTGDGDIGLSEKTAKAP